MDLDRFIIATFYLVDDFLLDILRNRCLRQRGPAPFSLTVIRMELEAITVTCEAMPYKPVHNFTACLLADKSVIVASLVTEAIRTYRYHLLLSEGSKKALALSKL